MKWLGGLFISACMYIILCCGAAIHLQHLKIQAVDSPKEENVNFEGLSYWNSATVEFLVIGRFYSKFCYNIEVD
jgi:hypothetical protein